MKAYLDNGATTRTDPRVLEAMRPYFLERYGNPSSLHEYGREASEALEESRKKIACFLNAQPNEIVFTASGSESDNLALQGAAFANKSKGKHIVTSSIEHPAVLNTFKFLEKNGFEVTILPVDTHAVVSLDAVAQAIRKDTILVSVMHANNEVGTIQDINAIARVCKERSVLFHTDAVQSFTKVPIDLKKLPADLLSISAHKIHGPKGVAALYVRSGTRLQPLVYGGVQERGLRAGTENVPGAVGFAKAAELAFGEAGESIPRMTRLRDELIKNVTDCVPDSFLNGHPQSRLCNNAHFRFDFIEGESLLMRLDALGIEGSTGSACSSKSLAPSHVLLAMGLTHVQAHGSLRLTLSRFTTREEVSYAAEKLPGVVEELRKISPLKKR